MALAACAVPEPLSPPQIDSRVAADRAALKAETEAVTGPITLEEALARALKHNLDHRIKAMEVAIAQGEADLAHWDLLPRVVANAGYTGRSNEAASNSLTLSSGEESQDPTTSTEKGTMTADLSMAWNVLDFGVSYLRARQQADRRLIAEERRRKVVQSFVQDVRYAWWKALGADRLLPRVEVLHAETRSALEDSRAIQKRGLQPPVQALEYQMSLLETLRQIGSLQRDLVLAKTELGSLMGLLPGTPFEIARPEGEPKTPTIPDSLDKLQEEALRSRPELREEDYNERIGVAETRKAILRMLPGLEMTGGLQYSDNHFLVSQSWMEGGLKLSWNLVNLASGPPNLRLSEAREALTRKRRLALSMAVLTQVNVGWIRFRQAKEDYELARELHDVAAQLRTQSETARAAKAETGLETIRRASRAVFMELQRDVAYAELQHAVGRLFVSSGADPLPASVSATDLPTLAAAIDKSLKAWSGQVSPSGGKATEVVRMSLPPPPAPAGKSRIAAPPAAEASAGKQGPVHGGAASTEGYFVHVASLRSAATAEENWTEIVGKHRSLLAGMGHTVAKVDLGAKGTWYRVLAGPYTNADKAEELCDRLWQGGIWCLVVGPRRLVSAAR